MPQQYLEVINPYYPRGHFRFALMDFDGTLSLIREGWQAIMKSYFYEEMIKAPAARDESNDSLKKCIDEFVEINTGKQTIYQCIALADEIRKRKGSPLDPQDYKDEYQRRLLVEIDYRIKGLENGSVNPSELFVPGGEALLKALKERDISIFIASGTDEVYAQHEAELLGVTKYITGKVYGAQRDYKSFSKAMVVNRIITENHLKGEELLGFGDGFVEIENVKERDGFGIGVATDEKNHNGQVDAWKRQRLIRAGADIIIPDYSNLDELMKYLFPKEV